MTNELLSYVKDAVYALLMLLLAFGIGLSEGQIAAIMGVVLAIGALAIAYNSRRSGGAPQVLKAKAEAAEAAGIVPETGPPPTTP